MPRDLFPWWFKNPRKLKRLTNISYKLDHKVLPFWVLCFGPEKNAMNLGELNIMFITLDVCILLYRWEKYGKKNKKSQWCGSLYRMLWEQEVDWEVWEVTKEGGHTKGGPLICLCVGKTKGVVHVYSEVWCDLPHLVLMVCVFVMVCICNVYVYVWVWFRDTVIKVSIKVVKSWVYFEDGKSQEIICKTYIWKKRERN